MTVPLLLALPLSLAMIGLLWHGDPKRRRVRGLPATGNGANTRRLLLGAALLPGIGLAASGDSAAFLIWFGACAVGGWLVSQTGHADTAD
jgi:hypothetical protein